MLILFVRRHTAGHEARSHVEGDIMVKPLARPSLRMIAFVPAAGRVKTRLPGIMEQFVDARSEPLDALPPLLRTPLAIPRLDRIPAFAANVHGADTWIVGVHVEWGRNHDLIHTELVGHPDRVINLVRIVLEREELPHEERARQPEPLF